MRVLAAWIAFVLLASGCAFAQGPTRITHDQAIELALKNSPALRAARTQIDQNRAQEVTAGLRPNPVLSGDSQFMPIFHPSLFTTETVIELQQFDLGFGYLIERASSGSEEWTPPATRPR